MSGLSATQRAFLFACEVEGFLSAADANGDEFRVALLMLAKAANKALANALSTGGGSESDDPRPLVLCDALALAVLASQSATPDDAAKAGKLRRVLAGWLQYRCINYSALLESRQIALL